MSSGIRILDLLPHRSPMLLLSEALVVDVPGEASAVADTSPDSVFYDSTLGGVPACVALEYMAQTMALAVGAGQCRKGASPKIGFVLGTRRLEVKVPAFVHEKRYVVTAKCMFADDESCSFDCKIAESGGEVVAAASLSAYQPTDDMLGISAKAGDGD